MTRIRTAPFVLASCFALALTPAALAGTVSYGGPSESGYSPNNGGVNGDCTPFCTTEYQQFFNPSRFSGPVMITGITFHGTYSSIGGNFTISLSNSARPYNSPTTNLASNFGTDTEAFYTGAFVNSVNGSSTFTGAPYLYDPSQGGSLLLDVVDSAPTSGAFIYYTDYNYPDSTAFSRAYKLSQNGKAYTNSGYGDYITFDTAPVAVTPEPSSLALLGTGLLGVLGVARKRFA